VLEVPVVVVAVVLELSVVVDTVVLEVSVFVVLVVIEVMVVLEVFVAVKVLDVVEDSVDVVRPSHLSSHKTYASTTLMLETVLKVES
jgi:hypothetical protein